MLLFEGLRCTDLLLRVAEREGDELFFVLWYTSKNVSDVLDMARMLLFFAIIYWIYKNTEKYLNGKVLNIISFPNYSPPV